MSQENGDEGPNDYTELAIPQNSKADNKHTIDSQLPDFLQSKNAMRIDDGGLT